MQNCNFNKNRCKMNCPSDKLKDYGKNTLVIDLNQAAIANTNFRTALWTGTHLQMTLMCIPVNDCIGLEVHPDTDQFISVECGTGYVLSGCNKEKVDKRSNISKGYGIFIPAGTYHNIINAGNIPLKLYSIYAPPHHKFGTIERTKID